MTIVFEPIWGPNEEEAVVEVFQRHNFYYPVEITVATERPLVGFPWIKPSDFLRALGSNNDLGQVLGGRRTIEAAGMLRLFWSRYEGICPKHELFGEFRAGKKDPSRCIPMFLHGDEGTTYKKGGVLVLSIQGCIGFGSTKRSPEEVATNQYPSPKEEMPLNFMRPGMETRLLMAVCPKDMGCMQNYVTFAKKNIYGLHKSGKPVPVHVVFIDSPEASEHHPHRRCTPTT